MCHHHVSQNYTHGSCWDLFIIFTVAELPFETMPLQAVDTLSEQDTQFQCLFITCQPSNYLSAHYCLSTWVLKIIQCLMLFSAHLSPIVPLIASSNLPRLGLSQFRRRPASDVAFRRSAWVLVWIHLEGGSSPKVWWEPWRWCLASSPPMVLATTSMDPLWNQVGLLDATNAINHNFLKLLPHVMSFVFSVVAWGSQTTKKGSRLPKKGQVLSSPITLKSFGCISKGLSSWLLNHTIGIHWPCISPGCFGSTWKANRSFLSLRGSRVWILVYLSCFFVSMLQHSAAYFKNQGLCFTGFLVGCLHQEMQGQELWQRHLLPSWNRWVALRLG